MQNTSELVYPFAIKMLGFWLALLLFLANVEKIQEQNEQRVTLKYLVKCGFTPINCWQYLRAIWRDKTVCKTQVRMWHKRFLTGHYETKDNKRTGRPRTKVVPENIQMISDLLAEEGKLSLREICSRTGLKMGVVTRIVKKELKLRRRAPSSSPLN